MRRSKFEPVRTSLLILFSSSLSIAFQSSINHARLTRLTRLTRLPAPVRNISILYATEYLWELDSKDGVLISDLLLEMGAESTQVVLAKGGIELDDPNFDKTGKMQTASSTVTFSTRNDASAHRLVRGVSDIMDLDAAEAWRSCRKQEVGIENTFDETTTDNMLAKDYEVQVGDQKLVFSNSQGDTAWAFGDGKHPSTRVSLAGLELHVTRNCSILDYGCGSGILGLTARALGASRVTAVDISNEALDLTRQNFERNYPHHHDIDADIQILHGKDYIPSATFDIVVANIPANTLVTLLGTLVQSMHEDGLLLLSGYPTNEADLVSQAAGQKHNLEVVSQSYDSGWVLQVLQRMSLSSRSRGSNNAVHHGN